MDCSLPGSSVHGMSQGRILGWVSISFSRGFFSTQGLNPCLLHFRQSLVSQADLFLQLSHQRSPPSVSGHLGCFHVLAVVNSAITNIRMHVSFDLWFLLEELMLLNCGVREDS